MNRFMVYFNEVGFIPVNNEPFYFDSDIPRKVGDDAIIVCQEMRIQVRLLRSVGHVKNGTYLVAL